MPYLRTVPAATVSAFYLSGKDAHPAVPLLPLHPLGQLILHHIEHIQVDNRLVAAFHIVLSNFAYIRN
jgi:hypothetical protein